MRLENVVNPPSSPTNTNTRSVGVMARRPDATSPASAPATAAPITLTPAVAYGTGRPSRESTATLTPWRASDPSAPPTATATTAPIAPIAPESLHVRIRLDLDEHLR